MEVVRVRYLQLFYSTLLSAYMQPWKLNTFFFFFCTVKILEVDLTLKRSSQLQSWFIQVQVVVHLLLQVVSVTLLVQLRFLANNECEQNSFCDCIFVSRGGINFAIFMHYWMDSENYSYANIHAILELWVHKGSKLALHCGKSGRWYRSCNWGKPFWVKLTSGFFQCVCCNVTIIATELCNYFIPPCYLLTCNLES